MNKKRSMFLNLWFLLLIMLFSGLVHAQAALNEVGTWGRGPCNAVCAFNNRLYMGTGRVMDILDISNPQSPVKLGSVTLKGYIYSIDVSGSYAYAAVFVNGLQVVDISNPASPTVVGLCDTPAYAEDVHVAGSYAYVAAFYKGLRIIDISTPSAPTETAYLENLGNVRGVFVSGSYAYAACENDGLRVIDISTPTAPVEVGHLGAPLSNSLDVFVSGTYAYVADRGNGLRVVDISNPQNPNEVAYRFDTTFDVHVSGNYAYTVDSFFGIRVYDISNPANPLLSGTLATPGNANDIHVLGSYAYVSNLEEGMRVVDVSNPAVPSEVASVDAPDEARGVDVSGNYAYIAYHEDGLRIINISSPTSPAVVGELDTPGIANNVRVSGGYAYLTELGGDLRIINISNPASPSEVGSWSSGEPLTGLDVKGNYVYLANMANGLIVINVSNPASPTQVGSLDTPGNARDVMVYGTHAYVADNGNGLVVIDISDPASMSIVSTLSLPDTKRIFASGIYSYLVQEGWGLRVADIQDPLNPVALGLYGSVVFSLDARGAYVYTTDYGIGFDIYDVSNPSTPVRIADNTTLNGARDVRVANGYAYVADGFCGLSIIDAAGYMPYINVTTPGGSETWPSGSTQQITWGSSGIGTNVRLEYSTDAGATWIEITAATENDGIYDWTVPNDPAADCKVRVTDLTDTVSDMSTGTFTIEQDTALSIIAPNGFENFFTGEETQITWNTSDAVDNVVLYYSSDGGITWNYIDGPTPDTGSYSWTTPNIPSDRYLVKIEDENLLVEDESDNFFTVSASTLEITAPNGPEQFFIGAPIDITWNTTGTVNEVMFFYSTNDGITWDFIDGPVPNTNTYSWTLPNIPSEYYRIRIEDAMFPDLTRDESDDPFTVLAATLEITAPNGPEQFFIGTQIDITWNTTGPVNEVILFYSTNDGITWDYINGPVSNTNTYSWTLPNVPSDYYRVRIEDAQFPDLTRDESDAPFTVSAPTLEITSPNGPEQFFIGTQTNITWNTTGPVNEVILFYSTNDGITWDYIDGPVPNNNTFSWTLPNIPSDYYRVRIENAQFPDLTRDESDAPFIVSAPTLEITAPNGPQQFYMGTGINITWNTTGPVNEVVLFYSTNDGITWNYIDGPVPNTNTYSWTLPNIPGDYYRVRIENADFPEFTSDVSDAPFTVSAPTLEITAPNGFEQYYMGTDTTVTWNTGGPVLNVMLFLSTDGGGLWQPITSDPIPNTGSYLFTMPNIPSGQCLVKIENADFPELTTDVSDNYFSILAPTLTITYPNTGSEEFFVGGSEVITWNTAGPAANVMLYYSIDGGAGWAPITGPIANTGSFSWTVPDTPSNQCLVKIEEEIFPNYTSDVSDGMFTISPVQIPASEREALIELYNSTNGDGWTDNTNWRDPVDPGQFNAPGTEHTWFGVTVNSTSGKVEAINLQNNNLVGTIPDPSYFTDLLQLNLSGNQLDGVIPYQIGNLAALTGLHLENNQLSGSIPVETGNLTGLTALFLQGNRLTGDIPTTLTNLTNLPTDGLNISWNGLHTGDGTLKTFLDSKQVGGDWESTQTIAPTGLTVDSVTDTSAVLSWTPILYQADGGGYNIYYSITSGSGYTLAGTTADKYESTYTVNGLEANTTYYFVVETVTDPNVNNQNTVTGEYSTEASGTTDMIASITVISPNGSEGFFMGYDTEITWTSTGTVNDVIITYSHDSGYSWSPVSGGPIPNTGAFTWTIPNTPSDQCLVRIEDGAGMAVDQSNTFFNIAPPTITVTNPNTNFAVYMGYSYDITWTTQGKVDNVIITYYDGYDWYPVSGGPIPNTGTFNWLVPNTPSDQCLVRIEEENSYAVDQSDTYFTIAPPTITVTNPNTNFAVYMGYSYDITWTTQGKVDNVIITYYDGYDWYPVSGGPIPNTGTFNWLVPNTPSNQCLVRIEEENYYAVDQSDTYFTIAPPTITVTAPNTSFAVYMGYSYDITWTTEGKVDNVIIWYTYDGYDWYPVSGGPIPNTGTFDWLVPNTPSNQCLVRIDEENLFAHDQSDFYFTIAPPTITVTFPDGSEDLTVGSSHDITWTSAGKVDNVVIRYSYDGGFAWQPVSGAPIPNTGTFTWTVPDTPSGECLVIVEEENFFAMDQSNGFFTISPMTIPTAGRDALIALYNSTDGDNWTDNTNWRDPGDPAQFNAPGTEPTWFGVTVSGTAHVQGIDLQSNSLSGTIPDLSSLTYLRQLNLSGNQLTGTIPFEIGNLAALNGLHLENNQLSGSIPVEIGNLTALTALFLQGNQLGGSIPTTLTNLTVLPTDGLNISWNGLYTTDGTLKTFLDSKQVGGDWESTQTIAPTGLAVDSVTATTASLSWTPILYQADSGTYRVYYSTISGSGYTLAGATGDKYAGSYTVTGLSPATTYYFVVETVTDPHVNNQNTVTGEYSTEVSGITGEPDSLTVISPDGSESWEAGFTQSITWSGTGSIANVMIEYSTDNGAAWNTVTASTANTGSYDWTVPNTPSPNCLVRVTDTAGPASDTSNGVFNILEMRTVVVNTPIGGEEWFVGSDHDITWATTGDMVNVSIDYSTNNGGTWNPVVGSTPNTGSFTWTIPGTPSIDCLVKVSDTAGPAADTCNAVFTISSPRIPQGQRDALIALYNSTNGDSWYTNTNWRKPGAPAQFNDPGTENTWYGVTCDAGNNNVLGVNLYQNGLSGTIPDIGGLTELTTLNLGYNQLTGNIPASLNNLTQLTVLNLKINQLDGAIPGLSNLLNLVELYLSNNYFFSSIPSWLNNFTNLTVLHLQDNSIYGPIPDLSNLTNLTNLNFGNNQLIGDIPAWLNNLTGLTELWLYSNYLSGVIPDLSNLTQLTLLSLGSNNLTGVIPASFNNLTNLQGLYLSTNSLSGPLPDLGNLTQLVTFSAMENDLSGSIDNITALTQLQWLYLNENQFSGAIPAALGNLTNLTNLHLDGNMLTGEIPGTLSNLTNLGSTNLELRWNGLYTGDPGLRDFLNSKQYGGNWESTQTIAPGGVSTGEETHNSVKVSWTPIQYQSDSGGYRVYYSTTSGSDYQLAGTTNSKTDDNFIVTGLVAETTYYFVVESFTDPHTDNENTVTSEYSTEVSASTLEQPTLAITAPNGGQSWEAATAQVITWNSTGNITDVKVEYSTDNGSSWNTVIASTPNNGSYNWTVPNTPSTDCLVKITDIGGIATDTSDAVFTIAEQKTITVTAPDGSEIWEGGFAQNITWNSTGSIANVMIEYSTDSGGSWNTVIASTANSGAYGWTVPNTPSPNCLVRISDIVGPASDTGNGVFNILEMRTIMVIAPDGSEDWQVGSSHDITWSTTGDIANVSIEYSSDGGSLWNSIIASTPNNGTYNWTIPDTPSTDCLVKVSDIAGPASDTSNAVFTISIPTITQSERDALIALYNSTNGDSWTDNTNWRKPGDPLQFNDPGTEYTWYGVFCNAEKTHVTGIQLVNNNLVGTIPDLGSLTWLTNLYLNNNQLTGSIPTGINNLVNLQGLYLYSNQLSGIIPDLSSLVNLTTLFLGYNQLSGSVPAWLNLLTDLEQLHLGSNQLTGTIPDLSSLTQLIGLGLGHNQLTGNIPDLSSLVNLEALYLGTNQLSGSIPTWINNLTNLHALELDYNDLSGPIPYMGNLTQLTKLSLHNNELTGSIPSEITNMTNLTALNLGHNHLDGSIPPAIGNLTGLTGLRLNSNQLDGTIPSELGNLTNLNYLYLDSNKLTGSIPGSLANLTNLYSSQLDISRNGLYTADTALRDFLNTKQVGGDWEATQTIAPTGIAAGEETHDSINVSWTPIPYQADSGGYNIYYSTTSGSGYTLAGTTADKTVDNYTVTGLDPFTTYYFVVTTVTNPNGSNTNTVTSEYSAEVSAATQENPTLTVTAPDGGQSWEGTTTQSITWGSTGNIPDVKIEYSTDNGNTWNTIIASTPNSGSYNWLVPNTPSGNCLVKITDTAGPASDTSNAVFTIAAQRTITVTAPDGGQNWEGGTVQNITWTSTGSIPNVKIEYSTDTGGSWNTITASVSNSGSYGWTVPGTPSANCLVKISDTAGPASDTSNAVFTILQQRAITVTAPDGSESWEGGFTRAITWNSTGSIANVMIEYSTDTGGSWNTVIASTANSGSYNWTVPNTPSSNCSVRITDTAGPASDTSNGVFTITEQRTLTITVPNDGESWEVDSNQTITWLSTGNIVNVRLEYSTDGGGSWDTITSSTANSGSYSWNVPNDPSDNCLVKISDTAGPAWDESDVVFSITVPMIPTIEREALIALYNSTDGDNWTDNSNWRKPGEPTQFNDPGTEHTWYGVTCDAGNTFVTGINLLNNNLAGTIPVELNNLTQITSLNLGWNQLTGNIPNLGSLTGLTSLSFYNNQLTGNIPTWINNLTGLTSLHLAANQLSGAIPDLSSLVNLTYLNLSVNQLTGTIPTWINNFVNLSVLDLQSNQLTGTIPDLGNLTNLTFLNFDTNDLSGSIPAWINNLTQLTSLHMAYNQLTGVIPDISNLVQLTSIHLGYNQLTGPIPPEIATFTSLTTIRLSKNQLQGSIPTGLGNLTALRYLYLDENQLEGSIPSEIGNLTALDYLYLKGNKLVGSLPGTLSNLTGLNSGGLELRWNGLYTADTGLRDFLNTKQSGGDWESTQTIAPEGVAAGNETSDSVNVSWTPIQYQSFTGGYRVYYTTTSGSNYTLAGTTVDKTVDNYTVTGLNPGTTYYFVVETVTGSNALNQNTIVSEYSTEVSAGTLEELALTVITPNGSENWEGGTSQTITWDSSGSITTVMIEYSTDNGSSWNTVTGSTANSGSYNWTVPNTPSSDCLVKISDTGGPTSDTSNAVFTIAAQRSITVIAPNDGESWEIDSNQTITWTSTGNIVSVMIEYTTDGGSSWNTIASSTANSGSYSWDVPNDPSDNCLVKISDTAGPAWDESDAIFSITEIPPAVLFETGVVTGVGTSWQTVNLQYTYTSMVVVCSNDLGAAGLPAVCRVRNASGNSFEVMTQNPSGNALSGHDVHYIVIEEGVYTAAEHGVKMEAVKVASTATASSGSWIMESRSYNNSYTSPVVLGQVMTYNDAEWSVFWACSGSRTSPPTSGALSAGKHIAQDTDKTRNNETIGFIVLEAGTGSINDIPYTAAVGTDIVRGPDNTSTGYTYNFSSIPTASTAIISAAGMDGGDGGWPVFYGGTPLTSSSLTMAFDEDQIKDSERSHTTEQVAYAVFGTQ